MSRNCLTMTRAAKCVARRFAADRRGGVAMIFALVTPLLIFLSLVILDFSRASSARQALQESLDAATLIAARSSAITAEDIDAMGDKALSAQLAANLGIQGLTPNSGGRLSQASFSPNGAAIVGQVDATVTPFVTGIFTGGPLKISAHSEVVRSVTKFEIAMVLDTTGSMLQNDKIGKLRTAANTFIDAMEDAASRSMVTNAVKISVVPFSTTVRVSAPITLASYNTSTYAMSGLPTWLDGRARGFDHTSDIFDVDNATTSDRDRFRMLKQMGQPWEGCVEARKAPYDIQDTAPTTSNVETLFTPYFSPDEPDVVLGLHSPSIYTKVDFEDSYNDYLSDGFAANTKKVGGDDFTWRMAQGRPQKYNTTTFRNTGTNPSGMTYGPNAGCAMQRMQRLSTSFSTLKATVSGLVATGETNIPLGLMWGWHALSPNAPFADGSAYGATGVTKIIVLMTDGDNTMTTTGTNNNSHYHGYGYIWQDKLGTTSPSANQRTKRMDERLEALCDNIKDKKIVIYAVGVGVSNNSKKLLKSCATSTEAYYDVDSSAGNLNDAFAAIAGSIENLRISK